ncbi:MULTISPECIES: VOC family protein [Mycobacterium ulcerans group]|uniref:VOC domain-containing protein n=2 Tax=Mycobacterium ulcerans group TaxID=2993898 RepID=A0A9N7LXL2_9MYCO|nr:MULTISPECIES: extradiol dioxygenase [Mycobacterium ulcerans group]MBC9862666.1 hypothetical protein [Mycobacterium pseudoshottsii]BDN85428.1 hypothetical protein NJB1907Z4_P0800 [Mycobacterium pseudoshottsii]
MITGAHIIVYSTDAAADRAFFRDTLDFPNVDAGDGWLIFKMPPAEVAVHPAEARSHELYLMCDDLETTVTNLAERGVSCTSPTDEGWGVLTHIRLPGGGDLSLYQPRHERAC